MVPKSFGMYGHYRGDSPGEIRSQEISYAGPSACAECHRKTAAVGENGGHRSVSCETCHGPGAKHGKSPATEKIKAPETREFCALCHARNPARPARFPQIDLKKHWTKDWADEKCTTCHDPHNPAQK
jgi:hypothetical protein